MNRPNDERHFVLCLTNETDNLELDADIEFVDGDAQIMITPANTEQVFMDAKAAYELGMWLIAAASRIEDRYPGSVE